MNQDFKIAIPIERAYKDENGEMMIEGIASSDSIDSHETIFNRSAQEGFSFDITRGLDTLEPVEIEVEHKGDEEPMNCLGPVLTGTVTEGNQLRITARLDKDNPKAVYYFNKMTIPDPITQRTKQFGLSINGYVVDSHYEYNNLLRKNIRVFDRVKLKKIGIVRKPSNPDTWVDKLVRSVNWENVNDLSKIKEADESITSSDNNHNLESENRMENQVQDENKDQVVETETAELDQTNRSGEQTEVETEQVETVVEETRAEQPETKIEVQNTVTVARMDDSQISSLVDAISSVVKDLMDEVNRKMDEHKSAMDEVARKLEESEKTNKELVERLQKVEDQPVTAPGLQNIESVSRDNPLVAKKEENLKRAEQEKDVQELMKHKLWKEKYIGYGEFNYQ